VVHPLSELHFNVSKKFDNSGVQFRGVSQTFFTPAKKAFFTLVFNARKVTSRCVDATLGLTLELQAVNIQIVIFSKFLTFKVCLLVQFNSAVFEKRFLTLV
jgi:hypothetical protein